MVVEGGLNLLGLASLRATAMEPKGSEGYTTIRAEIVPVPTACPHCGSAAIARHGLMDRTYIDTPMFGAPTKLIIQRKRFRCRACAKTFLDESSDIDHKR